MECSATIKVREVDPVTARTGTFIRAFPVAEYDVMLAWCVNLRKAARRNGIKGEFVYTCIPLRTARSYQIYLLQ